MKWIPIPLLAGVLPAAAQWLDYHDARTPTKGGQPDLTAPAPRVNGRPDLPVWEAERTPVSELNHVLGETFAKQQVDFNDLAKQGLDVFWGLKPDEEPLRPEAAAILKRRQNDGLLRGQVGRRRARDRYNFNEDSWLDAFGHPRSETMHIRERYGRRDFGHMDIEITIDEFEILHAAVHLQHAVEPDSVRRRARIRLRRE